MTASSRTILSSAVLEDPLTSSPNGPWHAAQYLRVRCGELTLLVGAGAG